MSLMKYLDNAISCPIMLRPIIWPLAYARNLLTLYQDRVRSAELMQKGRVGEAEQPTHRGINAELDNWLMRSF